MFKTIATLLSMLLQKEGNARNRWFLIRFCAMLLVLIAICSLLFHAIMLYENRHYSWFTGVYWTFTTMSTLGYGDITFTSDVGKVFSTFVLLTGMVLLLSMLPFIFIKFFYVPWLERQNRARVPRTVPNTLSGHVIFTHFDHVAEILLDRLKQYGTEHIIVTPELSQALELHDRGYRVLFGGLDDPETYRKLRIDQAAMVVVLNDDMVATNIIFTIREVCAGVPTVANADLTDSVDILKVAGSTHVFQFTRLLGKSLARRVLGVSMTSNIIGEFGRLRIAEVPAMGTWLQDKSIAETRLRQVAGVNIVGLWQEGQFQLPRPDTVIGESTVLILAGTLEQLQCFDQSILLTSGESARQHAVLILGGGRVGEAICENLRARGIDYRVVEKQPLSRADKRIIHGSAADLEILLQAGLKTTPSIIITTHDDDLNIYLTIYCRRLRPDVQIISRASFDRNINTLHRAGANLVMSFSSLVTATVTNLLKPEQMLMLSEGLNVFRAALNPKLDGQCLSELRLRQDIGCSVVAIKRGEKIDVNPDPTQPLALGDELVLIGSAESEKRYHELYPEQPANEQEEDSLPKGAGDEHGNPEFGEEHEVAGHGHELKR